MIHTEYIRHILVVWLVVATGKSKILFHVLQKNKNLLVVRVVVVVAK